MHAVGSAWEWECMGSGSAWRRSAWGGTAWSGSVHGVGVHGEWECAWRVGVHGEWECMEGASEVPCGETAWELVADFGSGVRDTVKSLPHQVACRARRCTLNSPALLHVESSASNSATKKSKAAETYSMKVVENALEIIFGR